MVRGREEQHVGQVEVELQVVIAERVVLRRVEHLEQRARGIARPATGLQLVDLVDQHDGVHRLRFGQRPHDAAGPRTRRRYAGDHGSRPRRAHRRRRRARTDGRAHAATDSPSDVLPTPGGPTSARIAPLPRPLTVPSPRSVRSTRTARNSRMRSFTSSRPSWSASSTAARLGEVAVLVGELAPRQFDHRVEPVANPRLLRVLLAHALEPVELLVDRRRTVSGRSCSANLARYSATTSSSPSPSSLRIASIWRRSNMLALLLVEIVGDVGADLVLQLEVGERSRASTPSTSSSRASTSTVSSSSTRCSIVSSGEYAAVSASWPGIVDAGEHVGDAARATVLEDRLDDRAVLARRARGRARVGASSSRASTCTCSAPCAPVSPVPMRPRLTPRITRARVPFGRSPALSILAMVPTVREPAVDPGHEHDPVAGRVGRRPGPLRLVGLERDRDDHLRQHDALREGQQGQELSLGV